MCGRFFLDTNIAEIISKYDDFQELTREINGGEIFPTDRIGIIIGGEKQTYVPYKWGYTPSFAKRPLINARSESVLDKSTFRDSVLKRRCIVPATCYYEWKGEKGHKEKYAIYSKNEALISMAGIYDIEKEEFTILTRKAVDNISFIHDRMPLILEGDLVKMWLNPKNKEGVIRAILEYSCNNLGFKLA